MSKVKLFVEARMEDLSKTEFLICRNEGPYSLHITVFSAPRKLVQFLGECRVRPVSGETLD